MSAGPPLTGRYVIDPVHADAVFPADVRERIARVCRARGHGSEPARLLKHPEDLRDVEVLLTGWGAPRLDHALLEAAPRLRAVLHSGGTVRPLLSAALEERGVVVSSAAAANARPVAEFTVAGIVYALKHGWRLVLEARRSRAPVPPGPVPGVLGARVGLLGLGAIGREVATRLRSFDVEVLASDPYADEAEAARLGVRLVPLDELFATSDVLSVHAPLLPSTRGLVGERLLRLMPRWATLLNTSRGAVVDETALVRVLSERDDLFAVLDVTDPEPPLPGSPLFTLPNAVVTPHIAGSVGRERRRLGELVAAELELLAAGHPLHHRVPVDHLHPRA